MNKTIHSSRLLHSSMTAVTLAVVSLGLSNPAHAEGQITLYGIVDSGFGYANNVGTTQTAAAAGKPATMSNARAITFNSGTWTGSRWGLQGSEDLGGGLSTIFRLENGFNTGTGALGQGGAEFGRHAYVGLSDKHYGTLTMGRQYDPLIDLVGAVGGTALLGSTAAHPGDVDNLDHSSRVSNTVKYRTPAYHGFVAEALYGFGNQAGSFSRQNTMGIGGEYKSGPLDWGVAYSHANNAKTSATDSTVASWSASSDSGFGSSINAGYASARSRDIIATSATYAIGATTLSANYSHTVYSAGPYSRFKQNAKFDSAGIMAMYQANQAFRVGAGYSFTRANAPTANASAAKYNQFNVAAFYALSKRTELYLLAGYQKASGDTVDAYGNVIAATASVGDAGNGYSSASNSQALVRMGISHRF